MKLLDPRGLLRRSQLALAPRPDRAALAAGAILFYDNTKMDVGHYGHVFARLKAELRSSIDRIDDYRETIRGKDSADVEALAHRLAGRRSEGVRAVVIGLADMGVSPAMVALAIAVERLGMPVVCITAGPGSALARAHAFYRAGSLCIAALDIYPGSTGDAVEREVDRVTARVLAMLTTNGAPLMVLAKVEHPVDADPVADDGSIEIAAEPCDEAEAAFDAFERLHIGDGLPFTPPTLQRCERMRRYCPFPPDEVLLAGVGPSGTPIRVRDLLVAAVMAGCKPEYVPILVAALRAMAQRAYNMPQAITTSFSGGHFILASGPIADAIGMHGGQGCLGTGFRANAAIGRTVSLVLTNVCRSVPGYADLACLSSPARYGYCMAEPRSATAWPTIADERCGPGETCVMAFMAEAPHNIMDLASTSAASLMQTIIDCCTTLGSNNAYLPGALVLVLNPDHAKLLHEGGVDKDAIRRAIHAKAKIDRTLLQSRGLVGAAMSNADGFHQVTRTPHDVEVVVAGGPGGHSAVILPWALHSESVFETVRLPDGRVARTLEDFR